MASELRQSKTLHPHLIAGRILGDASIYRGFFRGRLAQRCWPPSGSDMWRIIVFGFPGKKCAAKPWELPFSWQYYLLCWLA